MLQVLAVFVTLYSVQSCTISITGTNCMTNVPTNKCQEMNLKLDNLKEMLISRLNRNARLLKQLIGKNTQDSTKLVNVAYMKKTGQSSNFRDTDYLGSEAVVDGNATSYSATNKDNNPYWWVDLGKMYKVERIEVINRKNCCGERLHDLDITIGPSLHKMSPCAHYKGPGKNGEHLTFRCKKQLYGRFVKMSIRGTEFLQLGDVKVFAKIK